MTNGRHTNWNKFIEKAEEIRIDKEKNTPSNLDGFCLSFGKDLLKYRKGDVAFYTKPRLVVREIGFLFLKLTIYSFED